MFSARACPGEKLGFHTEICEFHEQRILKIGLFHRVKELSKSNQKRYGVFPVYKEYKIKRFFCHTVPKKKLVFHAEICEFRE